MRLLSTTMLCLAITCHAAAKPPPHETATTVMADVNAAGDIVGEISDEAGRRRAVLSRQGRVTDLGTLGGPESYASAINDAGVIIGAALDASNAWRAFRYEPGQGMRDLGTLGGRGSNAIAISSTGFVAGYADVDERDYHAFVHDGRTMRDLGTLGGRTSYATDVNAAGVVVGAAQNAAGQRRAFVYRPGAGLAKLPTLGGKAGVATAVNDHGVVVGASTTASGHWHAFLHDGTRMVDLGALVPWGHTYATGISRDGKVVGSVRSGTGAAYAFIYANGTMKVVPPLSDMGRSAKISDDGDIVGAVRAGGHYKPVMMATEQRADAPWKPVDWLTFFSLLPVGLWVLWHVGRDLRDWWRERAARRIGLA
ncbi:HAF repeat-containing protein [Pseudoduganella armeniaca]|nr:HAF repeat-containing protein [Pseudoduganella armeniaca]